MGAPGGGTRSASEAALLFDDCRRETSLFAGNVKPLSLRCCHSTFRSASIKQMRYRVAFARRYKNDGESSDIDPTNFLDLADGIVQDNVLVETGEPERKK